MKNLVSILIPVYNRAHFIIETLESIQAQTHENWECILVDDGSTDTTFEVVNEFIKKDTRFQFYSRPSHLTKGPHSCRNLAYKKSKGSYIYFFDSDDILVPNALALRLQLFDATTDAVIAKANFFDTDTGEILFTNAILSTNVIDDYFTGKITYYVSGPLWSRAFLEQQDHLFDEQIRYLDDWDFNLRMLYQNPNFKYIDAPLFKYRSHKNSLSKQINYLNVVELQSEIKARNKHVKLLSKQGKLSPTIKKYLLSRYYAIYRDVLVAKTKERFFFFSQVVQLQWRFGKYKAVLKTIFGYLVYRTFNKGYFLIK